MRFYFFLIFFPTTKSMFSFVHLSTLITFCPTIFFGRSLAYPIRSTLSFFVTFVLHFNRSASRLIWTQSHPV